MHELAKHHCVRIVHLSDLHFGTVPPYLVEPLLLRIRELQPRVVVVSGDLTQRARDAQFADAAAFLKRIPFAQVVVPGNHDVPLYNVIARFADPLGNYRRHLGEDVEPSYEDDELVVIGVNTARSFTWKDGRISIEQMERLKSQLSMIPESVYKVVVMHHPIVPLTQGMNIPAVGRSRKARKILESVRTDIILAGHGHHRCACPTERKHATAGHAILVIQAGTTLSDRTRGTANNFNVLDMERDAVTLKPFEWSAESNGFVASPSTRFHGRGSWIPDASKNPGPGIDR